MSGSDQGAAVFTGLIDLLAEELGGCALATSDDFFAGMENLVKPGRGVFLPDEYTERGKWMDGWESRRKRVPSLFAGHDWCVLKLGAPGRIRGLDIDTNHFLGNHPPYASVEVLCDETATGLEVPSRDDWVEVLPQSPLRAGSQNLFTVHHDQVVTHVRLNIFPDGGVARFRVYGEVEPRLVQADAFGAKQGEADLIAAGNGGVALAASDSFFSPMNNLLLPQPAKNMGSGWESRRRRVPGHDWVIIRMAKRGEVAGCVVNTNHFKGNFPDRVSIEGIDAPPGVRITELITSGDWQELLPASPCRASERLIFRDELTSQGPFTHVRMNIFPDGGVSRLRIFGKGVERASERLNAMTEEEAKEALTRCCGASSWVTGVLARRPFQSETALYSAARDVWKTMTREDILEAFTHHPRIGADKAKLRAKFASTADMAEDEQAGARGASEVVLDALHHANVAYEKKFGYIFIVCARGKTADQMLTILSARIDNPEDIELAIAAGEQMKITELRLRKL